MAFIHKFAAKAPNMVLIDKYIGKKQESGLRAKSSTDGTLRLKDYGLTKKKR